MVSRKLSIYGFISAAAIVSGALAGCGGSSSSVQGLGGTVQTTGGLPSGSGTSTVTVPSSTTPQQVQVTSSSGTPVTGTLPAGETIPAGTSVAVVPTGVPIIQGLGLSTAFHKRVTNPGGSSAQPTTGSQGQIYVDGQNTGLTVDASGDLSGNLILVPGNHTITAFGPFSIISGSGFAPAQLVVGQFNFGVPVGNDGVAAIPTGINMKLPSDGGTFSHGPYVTVTYPSDFASSSGTLIIVLDSARTIQEGKKFSAGIATYDSLGASLINHTVPSTGVVSVTFNVQ
jgi:hypothetical protein